MGSREAFGSLISSRTRSGRVHFWIAGLLYAFQVGIGIAVGLGQREPGSAFPLGAIGWLAAIGLVIPALTVFWGWRVHGTVIELYEHGFRYAWPSGKEFAFLFSQVASIRRQTLNGQLAKLTFVLADGRSHTVGVEGQRDAEMLHTLLSHFPDLSWS